MVLAVTLAGRQLLRWGDILEMEWHVLQRFLDAVAVYDQTVDQEMKKAGAGNGGQPAKSFDANNIQELMERGTFGQPD